MCSLLLIQYTLNTIHFIPVFDIRLCNLALELDNVCNLTHIADLEQCCSLFTTDSCPNHYMKCVQVMLQAWEEYKVAVEKVCVAGDTEVAPFFKVEENIVKDACCSCPQVSSQPLNPGKDDLNFFLIHS